MTPKSGPTSPANPASPASPANIASPQLTAEGPAAVGEALKIRDSEMCFSDASYRGADKINGKMNQYNMILH